jgi:glyoxylase-like metal-dependent hydrolase (beta-lactamase superfamily II)
MTCLLFSKRLCAAFILGALLLPVQSWAQSPVKLYIFDCGEGHAEDMSRWSPGVNVGTPLDVSGSCYLIRHPKGDLIWDTGIPDSVASSPNGFGGQNGAPIWKRSKTLASQLEALGVKPSDIQFLAVSHTHPDHIGNVELFPQATLLVQQAEYDWPSPLGTGRFKAEHPVKKLNGDYDVFGDGTVTIISTPGHTPGHQCLMVKLQKTGAVILSGDAVHFKDNWDNRRVPGPNFNKEQTIASMQRIATLLDETKGQLWINHDKPQTATLKHSPEFYD